MISETRKTLNKLKKISESFDKINEQFFKQSFTWIKRRANRYLDKSVNKNNPHPTTYAREYTIHYYGKDSAVMINDEPNSAAIEFGIGQEGKAEPHALASEVGYRYDVNNHEFYGWTFTLPNGTVVHTYGYGAKSFLYRALRDYINTGKYIEIYQKLMDRRLRSICK